jgi:hypothetical protein
MLTFQWILSTSHYHHFKLWQNISKTHSHY